MNGTLHTTTRHSRNTAHCHLLIRETAKSMAGELYERAMRDNATFADWKSECPEMTAEQHQERFIRLMWPRLLSQARTTLAAMLRSNIAEGLKDQIADALIKDNELVRGRSRPLFRI